MFSQSGREEAEGTETLPLKLYYLNQPDQEEVVHVVSVLVLPHDLQEKKFSN